jgi:hypothetical protein
VSPESGAALDQEEVKAHNSEYWPIIAIDGGPYVIHEFDQIPLDASFVPRLPLVLRPYRECASLVVVMVGSASLRNWPRSIKVSSNVSLYIAIVVVDCSKGTTGLKK